MRGAPHTCALALAALCALAGCRAWRDLPIVADRPRLAEGDLPPETEPARVVAGPYVSAATPATAYVCYVTDRAVQSGARLAGPDKALVRRKGGRRRVHAIRFDGLAADTTYRAEALLGARTLGGFSFRTLPAPAQPCTLAFVTGGAEAPEALGRALARAVAGGGPSALVLLGAQVPRARRTGDWAGGLFGAYGEALSGPVVLHGADLPAAGGGGAQELFPAQPLGRTHGVDVGPVRVVFLAPGLLAPERGQELAAQLERAFGGSVAPWRLVVSPTPVIAHGPAGVHARRLAAAGPVFEALGVDLVVQTGAGVYHRSLPVGTQAATVRYVALPDFSPGDMPEVAAAHSAARAGGPGYLGLSAQEDRLEGAFVGLDGRVGDAFALVRGAAADRIVDRMALVSDTWQRTVQHAELERVVRQACQAVADPASGGQVRVLVTNPSPVRFAGVLTWKGADPVYTAQPASVRFELEPGGASKSVFTLNPNPQGSDIPRFVAESDAGLSAAEALVLTERRTVDLPATQDPCTVDGRADEAFWQNAALVAPFHVVGSARKEAEEVRAWLAAGPEGLRVRMRCALGPGELSAPTGRRADGDVWREESVEVYLSPAARGRDYWRLAVSARGTRLESSSREGRAWNPDWPHAVDLREDRYNVELVVPYRLFGLEGSPPAGTEWGVNLVRNRYPGAGPVVYQAAPTHGPNDRSGLYLRVRFPDGL